MKRFKRLLTLSTGILAVALMGLPQAGADVVEDIVKRGELRVAVQTQGPPVSFIDKNGKRTGFAMEVIEMMAKDMGVSSRFSTTTGRA